MLGLVLRNFPHQINQLDKIHASLGCMAELLEAGSNPMDDGDLGFACARKGVYKFRGLASPRPAELEARIRQERRKDSSDQGPRTFARDLRRTMELMGLVTIQDGALELTPVGQRLLEFQEGSTEDEYRAIWRDAVLRITLPATRTHPLPLRPAPLILRLVADSSDIEKARLAVAFEAKANTEREYQRIKRLARTRDFAAVLRRIGATAFKAANAVKIIPALLEQLGLLEIEQGVCKITPQGTAILRNETGVIISRPPRRPGRRPTRRRRTRPLGPTINNPEDVEIPSATGRRVPDPETMERALDLLETRTRQHQQLLRKLVSKLRNCTDTSATRDRYDLFAKSSIRDEALLFEAKTGGKTIQQARLALGQLCQYEFFDIRPHIGSQTRLLRVVVFDQEPGQDVRNFLEAFEVLVVVFAAGAAIIPEQIQDYFQT